MSLWKEYYLASNLTDALQALASAPSPSRVIAGGTDLLLDIQQGRCSPVHTLIDVTRVPELRALEIRHDDLFVGAAVPLHEILVSPLVQTHALALVEACGLIGGPQVRNTATLGGNVAHALPAGDGSIALLALGARAEVAGLNGYRFLPIQELFLGPGRSALVPAQEVLVGFYLPIMVVSNQASAFKRVMRPQGVALPILNLAAWLQRQGGLVQDLRIAIGPAGPVPQRALAAEEALRGKVFSAGFLEEASASISVLKFRTSPLRASAVYRQHLAGVLLREVLFTAWERAGKEVVCG